VDFDFCGFRFAVVGLLSSCYTPPRFVLRRAAPAIIRSSAVALLPACVSRLLRGLTGIASLAVFRRGHFVIHFSCRNLRLLNL